MIGVRNKYMWQCALRHIQRSLSVHVLVSLSGFSPVLGLVHYKNTSSLFLLFCKNVA